MPKLDLDVLDFISQPDTIVQGQGLDQDIVDFISRPDPTIQVDKDIIESMDQLDKQDERRRKYLRDKYVWGLTSPLRGTRSVYTKDIASEVIDPDERRWVTEEVARIAGMKEWAEKREYGEAGYLGQRALIAQKIGGSFVEAGTGMIEAVKKLTKGAIGRTPSPDDIRFLQDLEAAKQGANPYISRESNLPMKAVTGAAGMAPDMAAGILAFEATGPMGAAAYWSARQFPERREDLLAMGASSGVATAAGAASAGVEAAIELINIDPTGLAKIATGPIKKAIGRKLGGKVIGKIAGEAAEKVLRKFGKTIPARAISKITGETIKRTGLETLEEGLQAATQEGIKYIVAKADGEIKDRDATKILSEAYTQAKEALPGIAALGGVGGAAQVAAKIGQFKKFTAGTKRAKIENEIMQFSLDGKSPSRKKWKEWGLEPEEGQSIAQRREAVNYIAGEIRGVEVARAVSFNQTPTAEQWRLWNLPEEEGKTGEQRKAFLDSRYLGVSDAAGVAQQPEAPVAAQEAAVGPPIVEGVLEAVQAQSAANEGAEPLGERAMTAQEAGEIQVPKAGQYEMQVEMKGTGERIGGREVNRRLSKIWNLTSRIGRVNIPDARAIYKPGPQVERSKRTEEASVAVKAHELSHHFDATTDIIFNRTKTGKKGMPNITGKMAEELGKLDYDSILHRVSEGFAEFVRGYLTGETFHIKNIDLNKEAPIFLNYFNQYLDTHPDIKGQIGASLDIIGRWRQAGAVGRVMGQISKTGIDVSEEKDPLVKHLNDIKEFLYTKAKEEGRSVKLLVEAAKKRGYTPGGKTTPFEDYNALRQSGMHLAANAIEHGIFRVGGKMEQIGPSFRDIMGEIKPGEDYTKFVAWVYAKSSIESWEKGKHPGITLKDAQFVVQELYAPRYERALNKATEYANSLLDVLVDVGRIEAKEAQKVKEYYKYYLPLRRAKKSQLRQVLGAGHKFLDLSSVIKRRSGSGLQIIDPMESLVARTIETYEQATAQYVVNNIAKTAKEVKGLGEWAEFVPEKTMAIHFKFEDIKKQLAEAMGESALGEMKVEAGVLDMIDPMTALAIWRPDRMKVNGEPIFRISFQGKPGYIQLKPELAEALGGLETQQNIGIVTHIVKAFTKGVKLGATRFNPGFWITNALRDYQTFLMQGTKGLRGAFDPAYWAVAYIYSELNKAAGGKGIASIDLWQKMGGELGTYTGLDRVSLRKTVKKMMQKRQSVLETGLNILGTSEVASRLAEFSANLEERGWLTRVKKGETPPMEVLIKAINASHDVTIDFRRMGKWGRYLNYWFPFFNARLEGLDKTIRTFKDNPARTALRIVLNRLPLVLLYWWYRHDDDDYKERPEWLDNFYTFADSEGNTIARIPKPQEWGLIDSAVERMLDAIYDKEPEMLSRWFKQVMGTVIPDTYPAGITPLFEDMFNYDSFRQRPVVSARLQKLEKQEQSYEYTSSLAKQAAQFLYEYSGGRIQFSPAKLDHFAEGISGGVYRRVTSPLEKILEQDQWSANDIPLLTGVTLRQTYAKSVDDFYSVKENIDKLHETNKIRKEPKKEDLNKWRRMQNVSSLMTEIRNAIEKGTKEEKQIVDLTLIGLARAAMERTPLGKFPSPFTHLKDLPKSERDAVEKHIAQKAITASRDSVGRQGHRPTAKEVEEIESARMYLRDMKVATDVMQHLAYSRLRAQGVAISTAKKRSEELKHLTPPG